jgi:lipopolysaccharide biosynthesis glycosyltransferase
MKTTNARQSIAIACAADDTYALPLSVMLVSFFSTLDKRVDPHVFIINSGISSDNKDKITQSIGSDKQISWCSPDISLTKDLFVSRHISHTSYLRLLLPDFVPEVFSKIIFLDSDMIIRNDLYKLWSIPIDDNYLIASQDAYYRYLSGKFTYLPGVNLPKNAEYFNAGVLVINLEKWRKEKIGTKILDCAKGYSAFLEHHDQDAMNIVLLNKWKKMDARWNQQKFFYSYQLLKNNPIPKNDYDNLINDPCIVHFTGEDKPWLNVCSQHPFKGLFFEYLDMTSWSGWRPKLTKSSWKKIKGDGSFVVGHQHKCR